MNKKVVIGAMSVAGAITVGVSQTANAEELVETNHENPQVTTENQVATSETEVTAANVATAYDELQSAQGEVVAAEHAVNQTEAKFAEVSQEHENAKANQAELEALDPTPEAIEQAEANVASIEQDLKTLEQEENQLQEKEKSATSLVNEKQGEVTRASDQVNQAQADVDLANKEVESAQKALDESNRPQAEAKVQEKNNEVKKAQDNVAAAQTHLDQAREHDANRADSINKANRELEGQQQKLKVANDKLTLDKTNLDQKESELTKANVSYQQAEEALKTIDVPVIKISQAYLDGLKHYITVDDGPESTNRMIELAKQFEKDNQFKVKVDPNAPKYDVTNLPKEVLTELTLFGANIINQVREKAGTGKAYVSQGSVQLGKEVADRYTTNNEDILKIGHHQPSLRGGASAVGLPEGTVGEEIAPDYIKDESPKLSLGELKQKVYDSFMRFMVSDVEYHHAAGMANYDIFESDPLGDPEYFGFGISVTKNKHNNYRPSYHFVTTSESWANHRDSTFNTTPVPVKDETQIQARYQEASQALTRARSNRDNANKQYMDQKQTVASLTNQINNLSNRVAKLKQSGNLTPNAQKLLASSQEQLAQKQAEREQAQKELDLFDQNQEQKIQQLAQAKAKVAPLVQALEEKKIVLSEKEKELLAAESNVTEIQKQIAQIKEQQNNKKLALSEAKDLHYKLTNYDQLLAQAKDNVLITDQAVDSVKAELSKLNTQLAQAKENEKQKLGNYTALNNKYQERMAKRKEEQALKAQLKEDAKRLAEYKAEKERINKEADVVKATALPETGEASQLAFTSLATLLSTLGLGLFLPRRKENQ
ncbi:SEC10/PgrA surface exclusion domain-containing protein [Hutsoniella sourekii]|uniref:SEC10/PgrA surface exclusion domain-containing protein n=1 Tax=Hutsoniella sourekii TaxID=87650 RepID=UPI00048216BB|nr:SEC10/PgrA surface exclusion domain-containing protein [Hutsoniella sourekii]